MSLGLVRSTTAAPASGITSTAGTSTGGSGSIILRWISWYTPDGTSTINGTGVTDSFGNTWTLVGSIASAFDGNWKHALYKCENPTGGASHTFSLGFSSAQDRITEYVVEYLGVSASSPVSAAPAGTTDAASPYDTASATTTQANEVLLAFWHCATENSPGSYTQGNSFTSCGADILSGDYVAAAYREVSSTGTYNGSLTVGTALDEGAASRIISLKLGAATGPTIDTQPSAAHKDIGQTATFSVTASASGGGSLSYQWKVGGTNVSTGSGGTTSSWTTGTLGLSDDNGSVTCAVTETGGSNDGSITTAAATLRVGLLRIGQTAPVFSSSGGSSVSPNYSSLPAIQSGDEIVLIIGQKPSTANSGSVTTPSGFTSRGSLTGAGGYSTTLGADTGNTNAFAYSKDTVSGSESGALSVTVGTNNVCWAQFVLLRPPPGTTVSYASATGSDTSSGNVSIPCGSDPGIAAGDQILMAFCDPTDAATFSAQAVTATGVTFGTVTEIAEPLSGTGNDIGGFVAACQATAGPSSAAPTFTATTGGTTTNARGPGLLLRIRAGTGSQTITPSGLASAEAHGTQTVTRGQVDALPSGIASLEQHGTTTITQYIGSTGIASAEAHGSQTVVPGTAAVLPSGVASAEAHGTQALVPGAVSVAPSGVASAEAFGSHTVTANDQSVSPAGVATAEAHGDQVVTPGAVTVAPSAVASLEAHGSTVVAPGLVSVLPSGLASLEAHGTQVVSPGGVTLSPTGLGSTEAHGSTTVVPGTASVLPSGVASSEAHGTAALGLNVTPSGVATGEAIGTPTVVPGTASIVCTGIGTAEAHGTAVVTAGAVLAPTGIASAEAVGSHTLAPGAVSVACTGIATLEAHGACTVAPGAVALLPSGLGSAEAHGAQTVTPGAVAVLPASVASAEAVGSHLVELAGQLSIVAQGLASAEAHGSPTVVPGSVSITPSGIASGEQHGNATITLNLLASAIGSGEAAGSPSLALQLLAQGLASAEAVGVLSVLPGSVSVLPVGIISAEAIGTGMVQLVVAPTGLPSAEAVPSPTIVNALLITPAGIVSLESFGDHLVLPGGVTLQPIGIASGELCGVPFVDALVFVLAGQLETVVFSAPNDTVIFHAPNDTIKVR